MTSNSAPKPIPVLVSASEIAEIAAVGPSAVSNWKRRHRDFPGEVEEGLYDRSEVVAWLRAPRQGGEPPCRGAPRGGPLAMGQRASGRAPDR